MPEISFRVEVEAGPYDRYDCPIRMHVPGRDIDSAYQLVSANGTKLVLQQLEPDEFAAVIPLLRAGRSAVYTVAPLSDNHLTINGVQLHDVHGSHIEIGLKSGLLTRYVYGNVPARPYFYPLRAPFNVDVTRSYPMLTDITGESHDHPHHRSLWIAHGEVNGTDNWSEESGHGFTRHVAVETLISGPIYGRFATSSVWTTADSIPLLREKLTVTAWSTSDSVRLLDVDVDLTAEYGAVTFGDTKEGGILAARVASSLDVPRGGRIENAFGGIDEAETWGRAANWCDYSGLASGQRIGLAILDHPAGFRHPTTWHVRNYGLMTANPFGYSAFTNGVKDGSFTAAQGQTLSFRYRVVLHSGDAHEGNIAGHYLNYACQPNVRITSVNP